MSVSLDAFKLLSFPSSSNGLSEYKPGISETPFDTILPSATDSRSHSPPRKTQRLEGDDDHSGSRTRSKGKGRAVDKDIRIVGESFESNVRKLKIDNPPENDITDELIWQTKQTIFKGINAKLNWKARDEFVSTDFEAVFQATRTVVINAGSGKWIYDKLRAALNSTASDIMNFLCSDHCGSNPVEWLREFVDAAVWFNTRVKILESMLTYLDRTFLLRHSELKTIKLLSMELFDIQVLQSSIIRSRIIIAIETWIRWERSTRKTHLLRDAVEQFCLIAHEHSQFSAAFFDTFVKETIKFYRDESETLSNNSNFQGSPNKFLLHCGERIREECQRAQKILSKFPWCENDIQTATEEALLQGRLQWLSGGMDDALSSRNIDGLARMYTLFSRVDGLKLLCEEFKSKVHNLVKNIVNDQARDEEMVDRLLEFRGFIDKALPLAFSNEPPNGDESRKVDINFVHTASEAFQSGFRGRRLKPAEMIAKYLDRAMRKGQQEASTEEFEKIMERVLSLYKYTQDKDVFRTFYHKALARRLLMQRSASDHSERQVLEILKTQYDPEFNMGDQMFKDLDLSDGLMDEFYDRYTEEYPETGALFVKVLQRSFWPFVARQKADVRLPLAMQDVLSKYTSFYKQKHGNRTLDFDHSLGTAQMMAQFKAGPKELTLSLYQAVILLLFNEQDEVSYTEIKENTGLHEEDLKRTLQSLACGKKKVLRKKPAGKDVDDTDVFLYNAEFTDPRQKVHINSIQVKETIEESKTTTTIIEGDRKLYLDAAIVRIMKSKQTMSHQSLITATIDAVNKHFAPDVRMIKERIERLIEDEYMKRDEELENSYVYVA